MLLVENKKGHVPELHDGKKYAMPCAASRGTAIPPAQAVRVSLYEWLLKCSPYFLAIIKMKEKLMHCLYCNDTTRMLVFHRYTSGGKRTGKLKRRVEHCTECNKRRIIKK